MLFYKTHFLFLLYIKTHYQIQAFTVSSLNMHLQKHIYED